VPLASNKKNALALKGKKAAPLKKQSSAFVASFQKSLQDIDLTQMTSTFKLTLDNGMEATKKGFNKLYSGTVDVTNNLKQKVSDLHLAPLPFISNKVLKYIKYALVAVFIGLCFFVYTLHSQLRNRQASYQELLNKVYYKFNNVQQSYEYGEGVLNTLDFLSEYGGEVSVDVAQIDLSQVGSQIVTYNFTASDIYNQIVNKSTGLQISVRDTKKPKIELNEEEVKIFKGDEYDIKDNIKNVSDEVEGKLTYLQKRPDKKNEGTLLYDKGWYVIEGDYKLEEAGTYTIKVYSEDNHGNSSTKEFKLVVQAAKYEYSQISSAQAEANYNTIYNYLSGIGFNKAAAVGILANARIESGFNPTAYNSAGYYGLFQWGGGRLTNLESWCKTNNLDHTTVEGQIRFMMHELGSMSLYNELLSVEDSVSGAANAGYLFRTKFERSAGLDNVEEIARSFYTYR